MSRKCIHRGRGGKLGTQAQAILLDAHDTIRHWPMALVRAIRPHVRANGRVVGMTYAVKILSWLTKLSTRTVSNTVEFVRRHGLAPRPAQRKRAAAGDRPGLRPKAGAATSTQIATTASTTASTSMASSSNAQVRPAHPPGFKNLLRLCAVISSHGMPKSSLPPLAHALIEARGDVGQSYLRRQFVTAFDESVYGIVSDNISRLLSRPLGGT